MDFYQNYASNPHSFYNTTDIVRWRNGFIGHGLMSNPEDGDFFADVDDRLTVLPLLSGLSKDELDLIIGQQEDGRISMEELAMAFVHATTLREICFLKDASPLLQEFRSHRENLYFVSREEYRNLLSDTYEEHSIALLGEWKAQPKITCVGIFGNYELMKKDKALHFGVVQL